MSPKIDYALLGRAVQHYRSLGYEYVEAPWAVEDEFVAVTCPTDDRSYLTERRHNAVGYTNNTLTLVGSAEQSFQAMDLAPGRYVGCTPCFRIEDKHDLLYQPWFMKVELFDNRDGAGFDQMMWDAACFMRTEATSPIVPLQTDIGWDLTMGGIEVGSYGRREIGNLRPWVYGTGLALPRFTVARVIDSLSK